MAALFSNIYKYRESPFRNQKENFVNEILCHILKNDEAFSVKFLNYIGLEGLKIVNCVTQNSDSQHGRPDISIELTDDIEVLIECKIDSMQGHNQIERYLKILKKKGNPKNKLIYITKYQEVLDIDQRHPFQHVKWHEIHTLLNNTTNHVSIELKNLLIEYKMSTDYKIDRTEITVIQEYNKTLAKLNDILGKIKDIAIKHKFEKIKNDKTLLDGNLGVEFKLKKGTFWIGFYQYDEHKEIQFGSSVELNKLESKDKRIRDFLTKLNYEELESSSINYWINIKAITFFFKNDSLDISEILKFSEDRIKEMDKIRKIASH